MNTQATVAHAEKRAAVGFLCIMGVLSVIAAAERFGFIGDAGTKRAVGWVIGLLIVVIGNLVPKIRPLHALLRGQALSRAERFAGWTLVLAGLGDMLLYSFASLSWARSLSAVLGLGAVAAIGLNWGWIALTAERVTPRVRSFGAGYIVPLMFAFLYIVMTACLVSLLDLEHCSADARTWISTGCLMAYCAAYAAFTLKR